MAEVDVSTSRPTSWPTVVTTATAAFAAGVLVTFWSSYLILLSRVFGAGQPGEQTGMDGLGVVVMLTLAGLVTVLADPLARRSPRWAATPAVGWALVVVGPVVMLIAERPKYGANHFAVAAGVVLGGALLAASRMSGLARLVAAVSLGAGLVCGLPVLSLLSRAEVDDQLILAATVVFGLLAVAGTLRRADAAAAGEPGTSDSEPDAAVAWPARTWTPVLVVGLVGLAAWAADSARRGAVDALLTPTAGDRRTAYVESADGIALVAISVAVAIAMAWYAYLRGGSALARWVVVGFALAAAWPLLPEVTPVLFGSGLSTLNYIVPVAIGVVATALGAVLTDRSGRWVPWDVLGVLAAAGLLVLVAVRGHLDVTSAATWLTPALAGAVGFALGAGLAELIRSRAARGNELAGAVILGLGALLFAAQLFWLLAPTRGYVYGDERPLLLPMVMVVAAVVLLGLFGMGRAVERVRRDIWAEAGR